MEEKRKNVRVDADLVVLYKLRDSLLAHGARSKNVSESGVSVLSQFYFAAGSLLELEIRSNRFNSPLQTFGQIVRISSINHYKFKFEMGVEFAGLPMEKRGMLREYVHDSMPLSRST